MTMKDGNLPYVVLALIAARQEGAHGYRLRADFNALYGDSCAVTFSQLYRILAELEAGGDLSLEEQRQTKRPMKRVYSITEKGLATLRVWLSAPPSPCPRPLPDEISAKLLLATRKDVNTIAALVKQHRHVCLDRLALVSRKERILRKTPVDDCITRLILDGAEARVRAELAWLERIERSVITEWA